jgi:hypothetical protein
MGEITGRDGMLTYLGYEADAQPRDAIARPPTDHIRVVMA